MTLTLLKKRFYVLIITWVFITTGLFSVGSKAQWSTTRSEKIVFSEVLYDSAITGESYGEWLELYNPQATAVNIGGWSIEDNTATFKLPSGTCIGPKGYLIITDDKSYFISHYGCTPDVALGTSLKLSNTGDYLILRNSSDAIVDQVAWKNGGNSISGWGSSTQPAASEGKTIKRVNPDYDTNSYSDWNSNCYPDPTCSSGCSEPPITSLPTVTTESISAITTTSACCGGSVIADGGASVTDRGVCWSSDSNPTIYHSKTSNGSGTGSFTSLLSNLSPNTLYYVRAYATNVVGTGYGDSVSFTTATSGGLPELNPPFGVLDTPVEGSVVSGSIAVTGWALDDTGLANVKIYLNQGNTLNYIGTAQFVEGARPDIALAYPEYPKNTQAGWGYMLLTHFLPDGGNGVFVLSAVATDLSGKTTILGTKTITGDNAHSIKPFGAIDTPSQGGTASGSNFINWGWVLTPQPNIIPLDGSTIYVWVDGVNLGHPVYNLFRSDIASLFPAYLNSKAAIGYYQLNTSVFSNGVHTIQWTATDSAGNTDGIGSRYFTIQNSTQRSNSFVQCPLHHIPTEDLETPIYIKQGYASEIQLQPIPGDENGHSHVYLEELEPLELHMGETYSGAFGYLQQGDQLVPLPIGSTFDSDSGIFYWLPGPGFLGCYEFVFIDMHNAFPKKKSIQITIQPKHYINEQ